MQVAEKTFIPFWRTDLDDPEIAGVAATIRSHRLSQGSVTEEFEGRLAALLDVPYVVATTSGSMALYMAMAVAGIQPGDEVIMPNRTFVATAHAAMLAGGKPVLVDVQSERPVIDHEQIEAAITPRTRAVCVVHLNGRAPDMRAVRSIVQQHGLMLIEDAAQGLFARNDGGHLGTQSDLGCFSLGVTKVITTGQGGFVATRSRELYEKLTLFRNHGVVSTFATTYDHFGFNLKYTDVQAAIGLAQLSRVPKKIERHVEVHRYYERGLAGLRYVQLIPVDAERGELPIWVEALVSDRPRLMELLRSENIETRPFLPDLSASEHLGHDDRRFVRSKRFARYGLWLPAGADQPESALERTISVMRQFAHLFPDLPKADGAA